MARTLSPFVFAQIVVSCAACVACTGARSNPSGAPAPSGAVCENDPPYHAEPTYSGPKAALPPVPKIPGVDAYSIGGAWTVYGLQHHLHSSVHRAEVNKKPATVTGYVVEVDRPLEPADKAGCYYPTKKHPPTVMHPFPPGVDCSKLKYSPPHFYIADSKDEKNPAKRITVMGYASSFIQLALANAWYDKHPDALVAPVKEDNLYMDNNYSSYITILGEPRVGSKVTVSGEFADTYQEGQSARRVEPFGILDITSFKHGKIDCDKCIDRLELR